MGYESPDVILYDINGNTLAVQNNTAIPASTPALMVAGSDGTNSRYLSIDSSGRQIVVGAGTAGTPTGGVLTIQGVSGGTVVPVSITGTNTISGTVTANIGTTGGLALDATLAKLTITQGTALGTNTVSLMGGSVTTANPTYTTGNINPLSLTTAGLLRVDGSGVTQPVSGTVTANAGTGNFSVVQATASNLNATVVGSGNFTVIQGTASNLRAQTAAESATGAAPPATGILIAGSVTTASPSYTTGQMSALSLTTAGALRTDSASWLGSTAPTVGQKTMSVSLPVTIASDQTTLLVNDDVFLSNTLNAANPSPNGTIILPMKGRKGAAFIIPASSTLVATIFPLVALEGGGGTYTSTYFINPFTGAKEISITTASGTAYSRVIYTPSGTTHARIYVSSYTSGSTTATIYATNSEGDNTLFSGNAGGTLPPTVAQIGGSVTSTNPTYTTGTFNALSLNTDGSLRVETKASDIHDATAGTALITQGGYASNAIPTAVSTNGDAVRAWYSLSGAIINGAYVETTAATRTNATTSHLSMSTTGYLRVQLESSDVHDAVAGNILVQAGGYASNTAPTAVASADATRAWYSLNGAQITGAYVETTPAARTNATTSHISMSPEGYIRAELKSSDTHDGAAGLYLIQAGGYASSTAPTAVSANGDAVRAWYDLNGRAQININQWLGSTAPTVGQKTMSSSIPVTIASDQSSLSITSTGNADTVLNGTITATDAVVGAPAGNGNGVSGSSTAGSYVASAVTGGDSTLFLGVTGTFGSGTVYFEGAYASTNGQDGLWMPITLRREALNESSTTLAFGWAAPSVWRGSVAGFNYVRARCVGATSPSISVSMRISVGTGAVFLGASLPAGSNSIGAVTANAGTGTFAVSAASLPLPSGAATETSLAKLTLAQGSTTSGQSGTLQLGAVTTANPSYTTGQSSPLSLDISGNLRVNANNVTGQDAKDAPITGNPILFGGYASNTVPTAVSSAGDMVPVWLDPSGRVHITNDDEQTTVTATGALAALNQNVVLALAGNTGAYVYVATGTFVGTIAFECYVNGVSGTYPAYMYDSSGIPTAGSITYGAGTSTTYRFLHIPPGTTHVRVRASAYTSGTSNVTIFASKASNNFAPWASVPGSSVAPLSTVIGGKVESTPAAQTNNTQGYVSISTTGYARVQLESSDVHDAVAGNILVQAGGYASNAIPTAVSANADATRSWYSLNGAAITGAYVETTAATRTNATTSHLSMTTAGALRVDATDPDTTASGSLAGAGQFVNVLLNGKSGAGFSLTAGLVGNINTYVSFDYGTSYTAVPFIDPLTGTKNTTITLTGVAINRYIACPPGATRVIVECTAYTSGSSTCNLVATDIGPSYTLFDQPDGTTSAPITLAMIGGLVSTSNPSYTNGQYKGISLDGAGNLRVNANNVTGQDAHNAAVTGNPLLLGAYASSSTPTAVTSGNLTRLWADLNGRLQTSDSTNTNITTGATALAALNAAVSLTVAAYEGVMVDISGSGTLNGTIVVETGVLAGYRQTYFIDASTGTAGLAVPSLTFTGSVSQQTWVVMLPPGASLLRVRVSAYTSGSITVNISASRSVLGYNLYSGGLASALPPAAVQTGGSVTTSAPSYSTGTLNSLSLNTTGDLRSISKITDGTNSATIKAASTAAVATDTALVVAISPNNPISVAGTTDGYATGTLNALNASVSIPLAGLAGAGMQLVAGTLIGTIVPEVSVDGGTTWVTGQFDDPTTGTKATSIAFASANTATTRTITASGGISHVRVRVSAFTSGTCNIILKTTIAASTFAPSVKAASTSAATTDNPLVVSMHPSSIGIVDTATNSASFIAGTTVAVAMLGHQTASFQLINGATAFSGSIVAEASVDGAATYNVTTYFDTASGKLSSITSVGSSTTLAGSIIGVAGATHYRIRCVSLTTGSFTSARVTATNSLDPSVMFAGTAGGIQPPTMTQNGAMVLTSAPSYSNNTLNAMSMNTAGDLRSISKITDGTNTAAVKAASTAAAATDPALVVAISPNNIITTQQSSATPTLANVTAAITSTTLIAANTARKGATIMNDSTANLYVKFGSTASTTSYVVKMIAGAYYEVPFGYNGIITGIWDAANGAARVAEMT